jgi:hypothetical protein
MLGAVEESVELLMRVEFCHSKFCPNVTSVVVEMLVPRSLRVISSTLLEFGSEAIAVLNVALPMYE